MTNPTATPEVEKKVDEVGIYIRPTHETEKIIQEIASKLGNKHNLTSQDFELVYRPSMTHWMIVCDRSKGKLRIEWGMMLEHKDFKRSIVDCIKQVAEAKFSRGVELRSRLLANHSWAAALVPESMLINPIARPEVEVELIKAVRIRHKVTGLVVVVDGPEHTKSWTSLIDEAMTELAKVVPQRSTRPVEIEA